jgi:hypothetical protein
MGAHPCSDRFDALCKDAGILYDRYGDKRAPCSLHHTYATFALL